MCCLHNCLHTLETVFPSTNLLLNRFPFFKLNLTEHVALDDDKAIELVYLGVDNFVLNCFDSPHFDVVDRDIDELRKLFIAKVGLFGAQGANLYVTLLDHELMLSKTLVGHQVSVFAEFGLEILGGGLCEQIEQSEDLGMLFHELLDCG